MSDHLVAVVYDSGAAGPAEIAAAARASGIKLLFIIDESSHHVRTLAPALHRRFEVCDITGLAPTEVPAAVGQWRPDGVMTFSELCLHTAAAVAAGLGLPYWHSPEVTRALTDKLTQRRMLAAAHVDDTACVEVASPDAVAQALAIVGVPAVMKPRRGTASRHVSRVNNMGEAVAAAEEFFAARPPGETLLMERLLTGDREAAGAGWGDYVSAEAVVQDGRYEPLCLTGRFPLAEPFRERGFFMPATLGASLADRVTSVAKSAVQALGVRHGIVHTEIKLTPAGPRVVEVNGRAGGPVPDLLRRALGFDLLRTGLRLALGIPSIPDPLRFHGVTYEYTILPPLDARTVLAIDGIEALRGLEGVDLVDIRAAAGQSVDWRDGAFSALGRVQGQVSDHAALADLAARIETEFRASYSSHADALALSHQVLHRSEDSTMQERNQRGGPALSASQRRLWLASKMAPESFEFTVPYAVRIAGELDLDTLGQAWLRVLAKHDELRLRVTDDAGETRRDYWPAERMGLRVRAIAAESLGLELERAVTTVFSLADDPLAKLEVLRLGPSDHVLLFTFHHIVIDGRSAQLMMRDLCAFYAGRADSPPSRGYPDYIAWESDPARPRRSDGLDDWIADLRLPAPARPLGFGGAVRTADKEGTAITLPIDAPLWGSIRRAAQANRTTPQVIGLTALALTLVGYTAETDMIIGATMDARPGAFADTIGMFINPAPVRLRLPRGQAAPDCYAATQRALLRAHSHRHVPFEEVVHAVGRVPDMTRTPLFEVLCNYEQQDDYPDLPGLTITPVDMPTKISLYDLTIVLRNLGETAELVAIYRTSLYTKAQIDQFARHMRQVLEGLTSADTVMVDTVPLLSAAEQAAVAALGVGQEAAGDTRPVQTLVADVSRRIPDQTAVICGGDSVSYRELHDWAGAIATWLAGHGVRPGDRVGIFTERSAAMVAAMLGVLRAGAAYVPVDTALPAARLGTVLLDADVAAMVTTNHSAPLLTGVHQPTVVADELRGSQSQIPDLAVRDHDAAYVIYTSGTTGEPKGVVVEHGNLAASTWARRLEYPERAVFLLVSPPAFDSCAAGLWGTLTSGGRLVVAQSDDVRDPGRLLGLIERHEVTQLLCVPSLYAALLLAAERTSEGRLSSLRRVIVAGEPLPDALLRQHFARLGPVELVNEYGPTETTVWASMRRYQQAGPVDIGRPIPGVRLYVLDGQYRLVPRGAAGELYVSGVGVSRGYLRRPGATAQAFVPDPFAPVPGTRMYRTGDRVRWTEEGTLEFLGRIDQQVKIRGHRVELGAVETALRSCPMVTDAVVVPASGGQRLAGFVTARDGFSPAATREKLARLLPEPMIPTTIQALDAFPGTRNGKVDRDALAGLADSPTAGAAAPPAAAGTPVAAEAGMPGSDMRALVSEAWSEILGLRPVPLDANFFDVGGYSLLVPSLQAALERRTATQVSIIDLFTSTTVTAQAALLSGAAK